MRRLCACNLVELEVEDATFVVAGKPCCDRECFRNEENRLRREPQLQLKLTGGKEGKCDAH